MAESAQTPETNISGSDESLINMPLDCPPSPLVVSASQYTPCGKLPSAFVQNFFVDFTDFQEVSRKGTLVIKWGGNCKLCKEKGSKKCFIKEVLNATSNFNQHINSVHPMEAAAYKQASKPPEKKMPGQLTLAQAFSKDSKYSRTDPRQIAITESVVDNLIIGMCLPIYIVERPEFRAHHQICEPKWVPPGGKWISGTKIPEVYEQPDNS